MKGLFTEELRLLGSIWFQDNGFVLQQTEE